MKSVKKYSLIFSLGALIYCIIEILWRGYTHISMAFAGGTCLSGLYGINERAKRLSLAGKCAIGSAMITAVEFVFGCIVNKILNLNVWDYSDRFMNLLGQICPLYSAFWFLLCIPAFYVCSAVSKFFGIR